MQSYKKKISIAFIRTWQIYLKINVKKKSAKKSLRMRQRKLVLLNSKAS